MYCSRHGGVNDRDHADMMATTMIHAHAVKIGCRAVWSPVDSVETGQRLAGTGISTADIR
jgi:hypothetical protein